MKTKNFISLLFCLIFPGFFSVNAQEEVEKISRFSIGGNFGYFAPYGDIKNSDLIRGDHFFFPLADEFTFGGGAYLGYQASTFMSLQAQFLMGSLKGQKKNFTSSTGPYHQGSLANLKFDAQFWELTLNTRISLTRLLMPCSKINNKFDIYGVAGAGMIFFRSQLRDLEDDSYINGYGWSNNGTVKETRTKEPVIPAGLGVKYMLSKRFDIYLESTMRFVFTDKLDSYVRHYNRDDKFQYTSLGVVYHFGKKDRKHMSRVLPVCSEQQIDLSDIEKLKKKVDDLDDKTKDIEARCCDIPEKPVEKDYDDIIKDLNDKIQELENKINVLEQEPAFDPELLRPGADVGKIININPIYFDFDKHDIRPDAATELDKIVKLMNEYPNMEIELGSHTDCRGPDSYNMDLSDRRAKASAQYIKSRITNPERIYGKGYGESVPRIDCKCGKDDFSECSEGQHQMNRRTEFIIIKI
jgi:outer membrane protein OmpA-like peptidoglycan-associated protein